MKTKMNKLMALFMVAMFVISMLPAALAESDDIIDDSVIEVDETDSVELVEVEDLEEEIEEKTEVEEVKELDGEISENIEDAGITPDSIFYFLDVALDKISLNLERNSEKRVAKGLLIAQERLSEIKDMAKEGKIGPMKEAGNNHGNILLEVEKSIEDISDDDTIKELAIELELENEMIKHKSNFGGIISELNKDLTEEDLLSINEVVNSLEGQADSVVIKINNKKSKTKVKITQSGLDADDIETVIKDSGLDNARSIAIEKSGGAAEKGLDTALEASSKGVEKSLEAKNKGKSNDHEVEKEDEEIESDEKQNSDLGNQEITTPGKSKGRSNN